MKRIVLLRHGESTWNQENRFTGWTDVNLSEKGWAEAHNAGQLLKELNYSFDLCFTSVLSRAILTAWDVLKQMNQVYTPVVPDWRLNERHYGALQGLNKSEMAALHGEEQVFIWRRSYDVRPPQISIDDPNHPRHDVRYKDVDPKLLPSGESLADTVARVIPSWEHEIRPQLQKNKKILIVAHGNSIRAMIKHWENTPNAELVELNIPTAVPMLYEFSDDLKPLNRRYLGNAEEIAKKAAQVASQGKAK